MSGTWGFDTQGSFPAVKKKYQGLVGKSLFGSFPVWHNSGWEIQSFQPPSSPQTKRKYSGLRSKSGFARFPVWHNFGWEVQSIIRPKPRKYVALDMIYTKSLHIVTLTIVGTVTDSVGVTAQYTVIAEAT